MSRQKKKQSANARRKHAPEFKSEALSLVERVGVAVPNGDLVSSYTFRGHNERQSGGGR